MQIHHSKENLQGEINNEWNPLENIFLLCPLAEKQSVSIQDALNLQKQSYKDVFIVNRIITVLQE